MHIIIESDYLPHTLKRAATFALSIELIIKNPFTSTEALVAPSGARLGSGALAEGTSARPVRD